METTQALHVKRPYQTYSYNQTYYIYNQTYYMDFVTFEVQGELFRIPKIFLTGQSVVFEELFTLPQGDGAVEGLSDENPISLPIQSKLEFERFLDIVIQHKRNPALKFSQEHWMAALRLGSMWEFTDIRAEAIKQLSQLEMPILERLQLGQSFGIRRWVVEAYGSLVAREEYITEEEVAALGLGLSLKLCRIREERWRTGNYQPFQTGLSFSLQVEALVGS